jgi:hypothetical protein
MTMMAMRARLAMTPIPPRLVRITADICWSSVHTSSGRPGDDQLPELEPPTGFPFAPTTAIVLGVDY